MTVTKILAKLVFAASVASTSLAAEIPAWTPGSYRGVVVEKSTQHDVLKTLGKPAWKTHESETGTPLWGYRVATPLKGDLLVFFDGDRVIGIDLNLSHSMTIDQFISAFGNDALHSRFSFAECGDSNFFGQVYRDPKGTIEMLEYPKLGVTADIEQGTISTISYEAKPISAISPCKPANH